MMAKKKNVIFTILAICCLLSIPIYDWLSNQKVIAFENTGRDQITSLYSIQKNYREKFGNYVTNGDELKKDFPLAKFPQYQFYTSVDELPAEYKKFLPSEALPFLKKESFRLVLTVKNKYANEICFWMVDENGRPKKLPARYIPETK